MWKYTETEGAGARLEQISFDGEHVIQDTRNEYSRIGIRLKAGAQYQAGTVLASKWAVLPPALPDPMVSGAGMYGDIWEPPVLSATDGRQIAAAVLYGDIDATDGIRVGIANYALSRIKGSMLIWPAGFTTPQKNAQTANLRAYGLQIA